MNSGLIYFTQTDTTAGFLSSSDIKLANIKKRPHSKKTLQAIDSFKNLNMQVRVPKAHRKFVRNSINTTFVYPNGKAFRKIGSYTEHYSFIERFGMLYSTSANLSNRAFDKDFAFNNADVVVEDKRGYFEGKPSSILKLNKKIIKKIR